MVGKPVKTVAAPNRAMAETLYGIGIANATTTGMKPYSGVVFPLEAPLLAAYAKISCRTMPGFFMAIWQAVHAFELFTGLRAAPRRFPAVFHQLTQTTGAI